MTEPVTSTVVAVPAATMAAATGVHLSVFWAVVTGVGILGAGTVLGRVTKSAPSLSENEQVKRLERVDAELVALKAQLREQENTLSLKIERELAESRRKLALDMDSRKEAIEKSVQTAKTDISANFTTKLDETRSTLVSKFSDSISTAVGKLRAQLKTEESAG